MTLAIKSLGLFKLICDYPYVGNHNNKLASSGLRLERAVSHEPWVMPP